MYKLNPKFVLNVLCTSAQVQQYCNVQRIYIFVVHCNILYTLTHIKSEEILFAKNVASWKHKYPC